MISDFSDNHLHFLPTRVSVIRKEPTGVLKITMLVASSKLPDQATQALFTPDAVNLKVGSLLFYSDYKNRNSAKAFDGKKVVNYRAELDPDRQAPVIVSRPVDATKAIMRWAAAVLGIIGLILLIFAYYRRRNM
jgi:hypothetical protein